MRLKNLTALILAIACFALAKPVQSQPMPAVDDYAFGWLLITPADADFYEVQLPLAVYQSVADKSLRDLGVYNATGQPVPRAIVQPAKRQPVLEDRVALTPLPLYHEQADQAQNLRLLVQQSAQQTTVTLDAFDQSGQEHDPDTPVSAYVVDLRDLKQPVNRLQLTWPDSIGPFIGRIAVHASNDLENWRPIGAASIAHLSQGGDRIDRSLVEVNIGKHDFIRLSWHELPADWQLTSLTGINRTLGDDVVRQSLVLTSTARDADDGGYQFDAGGWISVDQINLLLPGDNRTVTASIYAWSAQHEQWRKVHHGLFYHLRSGGEAISNEPVAVEKQTARRWKVVIEGGQSELDLSLDIGWRADKLVFVAQGEGPYRLVAGRAADAEEGYPQRRFSSTGILDLAKDSKHLARAESGPRFELAGAGSLQAPYRPDWGRWLIWLGLSGGVLMVGFMVMRLARSLK